VVTERLELRAVRTEDLHVFDSLRSDRRVRLYLGRSVVDGIGPSLVDAPGRFTVERTEDRTVVGVILLDRHENTPATEISCLFLAEYWGRGYATEAMRAAVHHALNSAESVFSITHAANQGSRRMLDKVGMATVETYEERGAPLVRYALARRDQ
jgi:RimJ/RimL family protein N-acetyltransferase